MKINLLAIRPPQPNKSFVGDKNQLEATAKAQGLPLENVVEMRNSQIVNIDVIPCLENMNGHRLNKKKRSRRSSKKLLGNTRILQNQVNTLELSLILFRLIHITFG